MIDFFSIEYQNRLLQKEQEKYDQACKDGTKILTLIYPFYVRREFFISKSEEEKLCSNLRQWNIEKYEYVDWGYIPFKESMNGTRYRYTVYGKDVKSSDSDFPLWQKAIEKLKGRIAKTSLFLPYPFKPPSLLDLSKFGALSCSHFDSEMYRAPGCYDFYIEAPCKVFLDPEYHASRTNKTWYMREKDSPKPVFANFF